MKHSYAASRGAAAYGGSACASAPYCAFRLHGTDAAAVPVLFAFPEAAAVPVRLRAAERTGRNALD